jgi:hypothetical protein
MPGRRTQGAGIMAALGLAALVAAPALAQPVPEPAPPPGMPNIADPPAESTPVPDAKGETAPLDKPLSEHLKQNEGVLEPPRDMDSKIQKQAPVPNPNTTPVLPPPGEPGGDQSIQPK